MQREGGKEALEAENTLCTLQEERAREGMKHEHLSWRCVCRHVRVNNGDGYVSLRDGSRSERERALTHHRRNSRPFPRNLWPTPVQTRSTRSRDRLVATPHLWNVNCQ